jgi:hypothetical protein
MNRYLFNFVGEDGKTFSDSLEQDEYREPDMIRRLNDRPAPTPDDFDRSAEEMVAVIAGQVENYRLRLYRGPHHHGLDRPAAWYVHQAISDEQADAIMMEILNR